MTSDDPAIFQDIPQYMRTRLMLASSIVFRESKWEDWTYGHEKLFGVVIWHYETKKAENFKYNKLLKKHGYGRTQNYKLLKGILERKILVRQNNGYYTFSKRCKNLIDRVLEFIKSGDSIRNSEDE